MGKRLMQILLMLAVFLSLGRPAVASGKKEIKISQADIYLPDIYLYTSFPEDQEKWKKEDISAQIKNTDITLNVRSVEDFQDTKRGIFYHVLLDVSNSVSEEQLEDMKASIIALSDCISDKDKLEVITFSNKIKVILKGGESKDKVKSVLDKVGRESKTHLYEGINKMSDRIAEQRDQEIRDGVDSSEFMRNVGIILTDWQEIKAAGGLTSQEESLKKLQKTGAPLYGYCLKTAKVSLQDDMGVFLRKTGGEFHLYNAKKKESQLTDLYDELNDEAVITIHSSSNKMYEDEKVLEIDAGEQTFKKEHIYLDSATEDSEKPTILKVEQKGEDARTVIVSFSEDVLRADNKNNYSIMKNGKQSYTVSEATYTAEDEKYQARLILNDKLVKGSYEVSVVNITDNTNEENQLTESWSGDLDGEGAFKAFYTKLGKFWALFLLLAVVILIFGIYLYIKKHKGIMVVEDEMVLGSNLEKKQHVKNDASQTVNVVLLVSGIAAETRKMNAQINGSAIVGRSSICDIYFDDVSMSRQHFALEVDKGDLYITDLNSTGGTAVDGIVITEKTRLNNGSVINAGSVSLVIRW